MRITMAGNIEIPATEKMLYWEYAEAKAKAEGRELDCITIRVDEDDSNYVCLSYRFKPIKFERLRRITGYLVGTTDRWNDAKFAELQDRVKHDG